MRTRHHDRGNVAHARNLHATTSKSQVLDLLSSVWR
jgi:hypothetical protein